MRYLYHFYPFVILACLGLKEFNRRFSPLLAALLIVGANIYGVFVLGILTGELVYRIEPHRILAVFHGALLLWLMATALRYQGWNLFGFPRAAVRRVENPPEEKLVLNIFSIPMSRRNKPARMPSTEDLR